MKILVLKPGSAIRTRDSIPDDPRFYAHTATELECLMQWLVSRGHEVTYFGAMVGSVPGVRVVKPDTSPIRELDLIGTQSRLWLRQQEGFEIDDANLGRDHNVVLQFSGQPAGRIFANQGVRLLQSVVQYVSPVLHTYVRLGRPRVFVNHDPRFYPREEEINRIPELRPAAILDQASWTVEMKIHGRRWSRKSTHAYVESWINAPRRENLGTMPCYNLSHAHVNNDIGNNTMEFWDKLHSRELPLGYKCCGRGWEGKGYPYGPPVSSVDAYDILNDTVCTPVVAHTPGFMTAKPYVAASQGCIPLLVSFPERCYDETGSLEPLNSPWRIREPYDINRLSRILWESMDARAERQAYWASRAWANFSVVQALLDSAQRGEPYWDGRFGGYTVPA